MKNLADSAARRAASIARKRVRRGREARNTRQATCWSSAMKARAAGRACAKCCRPRRRSTARAWRQGRADHRRAFLGRHARLLHRPCRARGGGRRPDRPAEGRRHHRHRRGRRDDRGRAQRRRTRGAPQGMEAAAERLPLGRAVEIRAARRRRRERRGHQCRRPRRGEVLRGYLVRPSLIVMAGLVPAIHGFLKKNVEARNNPGMTKRVGRGLESNDRRPHF